MRGVAPPVGSCGCRKAHKTMRRDRIRPRRSSQRSHMPRYTTKTRREALARARRGSWSPPRAQEGAQPSGIFPPSQRRTAGGAPAAEHEERIGRELKRERTFADAVARGKRNTRPFAQHLADPDRIPVPAGNGGRSSARLAPRGRSPHSAPGVSSEVGARREGRVCVFAQHRHRAVRLMAVEVSTTGCRDSRCICPLDPYQLRQVSAQSH